MRELFRVLKKGGMGIFQIPQDLNRETTFEDHAITDPKSELQFLGNTIMFVFTGEIILTNFVQLDLMSKRLIIQKNSLSCTCREISSC